VLYYLLVYTLLHIILYYGNTMVYYCMVCYITVWYIILLYSILYYCMIYYITA